MCEKITKEIHVWTSDQKLKWMGYGEWVEEQDRIGFEYSNYQALVVRVLQRETCEEEVYFGGHLCGYIQIPETHPYFRKKHKLSNDLDCHGGITFEDIHEEHWIGFDCAHSGDYVPTVEFIKKNHFRSSGQIRELFPIPDEFKRLFNPQYRNVRYCIDECIKIIDQLVNIKSGTLK